MEEKPILIDFSDVSADEGNRLAQDLKEDLNREFPTLDVSVTKSRGDAQDFGSTVAIILGTNAALAIAKGIADFLRRKSGVKLVIKTKEARVIAEGLDSRDAARIAEALSTHK